MDLQQSVKFQDENENEDERAAIEIEVNVLISEINVIKRSIYKLYEKNRDSKAFKNFSAIDYGVPSNERSNSICVPSRFAKKQILDKPALVYFQMFLRIQCKNNSITILFPRFNKDIYGLRFQQRTKDSYILEKCFLPHTFNMKYEREKYPLTIHEIPNYVNIVLENINAYSLRENQVKILKDTMDERIMLQHTKCYTEIELKFKVFNIESHIRKCATVQLIYPILYALPTIINIELQGDALLKQLLEKKCSQFTKKPLDQAYKVAFINFEKYKYFM